MILEEISIMESGVQLLETERYEEAIEIFQSFLNDDDEFKAFLALPLIAKCFNGINKHNEVINLTIKYTEKYGVDIQRISLLQECAIAYKKMGNSHLEKKCNMRLSSKNPIEEEGILMRLENDSRKLDRQKENKDNTCQNCMLLRRSECIGEVDICEFFRYVPTLPDNKPDYSGFRDASNIKYE